MRLEERDHCCGGESGQNHCRPVWPHLKSRDANLRRADQLAWLKQGPPADKSVPPVGQPTGVGSRKKNVHQDSWKRPGQHHSQHSQVTFLGLSNLTNFVI
jgi:hypothetical protein